MAANGGKAVKGNSFRKCDIQELLRTSSSIQQPFNGVFIPKLCEHLEVLPNTAARFLMDKKLDKITMAATRESNQLVFIRICSFLRILLFICVGNERSAR